MPSDVIADTIRQAQQVGVLPAMLGRDMAGEQEVVTSHNFFAKNDVAKLAELVAANPNLLVDDPANPGQKVSARALLRRETAKHTGELVR